MVKHTQTICRLSATADELFECVWPFCKVGLKGLRKDTLTPKVRSRILHYTTLPHMFFHLYARNITKGDSKKKTKYKENLRIIKL